MRAIKVQNCTGDYILLPLTSVVALEDPDAEGLITIWLVNGVRLHIMDDYLDLIRRLDWDIIE